MKKNLGKALPKTPNNYIDPPPSEVEIGELVSNWNQYAPIKYKGLLEAQNLSVLKETKQKPKGKFVYDGNKNRYIEVTTGRVLSRKEVLNAFEAFVKAFTRR